MNNTETTFARRVTKQRFTLFITGSIVISLLLIAISLSLYSTSGTAQLDLSRPGYEKIRAQVQTDDSFEGFPPTGPVDENALKQFESLYNDKLKDAQAVDAFGNDVLSPQSLQINQPLTKQNDN